LKLSQILRKTSLSFIAIDTKMFLAEPCTGWPSVPARTDVIRGGYSSIVGIDLLMITFLGNTGPPPYHYYKHFQASSGIMIKSLCNYWYGKMKLVLR
jgi:hypothetical protein